MKRLLEGDDSSLSELTELVRSAERHTPNPFAKRLVQGRLARAELARSGRFARKPVWPLAAGLLLAASAAAGSYSIWRAPSAAVSAPSAAAAAPRIQPPAAPRVAPLVPQSATPLPEAFPDRSRARRLDKPRAGEDPSQVAEAVRALRKQGDAARAQALLDRYLRENPRGALSEDALALSIEAAVARKDPRASEYARRYLARYPQGRFRGMAERVLSR